MKLQSIRCLKLSSDTGPDGPQGIRVLIACFVLAWLTSAGFRSHGFLFVAIRDHYDVDAADAAWPISTFGMATFCSGIVAGPLSQVFSVRPVIALGALCSSFGFVLSYWATSTLQLVFCYGVLGGFGAGTIIMMTNVLMTQYFDKYRSIAFGVAFSGSTMTSFTFPYLMLYLTNAWGFPATLLTVGIILSPTIILAAALHEAPWLNKRVAKQTHTVCEHPEEFNFEPSSNANGNRTSIDQRIIKMAEIGKQDPCIDSPVVSRNETDINRDQEMIVHPSDGIGDHDDANAKTLKNTHLCSAGKTTAGSENSEGTNADECSKSDCTERKGVYPNLEGSTVVANVTSNTKSDCQQQLEENEQDSNWMGRVRLQFTLFCEPMFYVLLLSNAAYVWGFDAYLTTNVDLAIQQTHCDRATAVNLITYFSVADLIGRWILPIIPDRGYLGRDSMVLLCYLFSALYLAILPFASYTTMVVATLLLGPFFGLAAIFFQSLVGEYLGSERLKVAFGLIMFFKGAFFFAKPPFIGYFRDTVGSFLWMYEICAVIGAVFASPWLIVVAKRRIAQRITKPEPCCPSP